MIIMKAVIDALKGLELQPVTCRDNRRQVEISFPEACGGITTIRLDGGPLTKVGEEVLHALFSSPKSRYYIFDLLGKAKLNTPTTH
jgi:hypothetical protein